MKTAASLLLLLLAIPFDVLLASPETDYLFPAAVVTPGSTSAWYDSGDNAYFLRFVGDETIEYKVDVDDPGVQGGYLRIYETTTGCYPIYTGGFNYNNSTGGTMTPDGVYSNGLETLVSHSLNATTLTLRYRNDYQGVTIFKVYEVQLLGKALKIHAYSDSARTSYYNNYVGFSFGTTENTPNAERILIPYMESIKTTMVDHDYFLQLFNDYTQSRASLISNASGSPGYLGGSTTRFINSVAAIYWRNDASTINPVDETLWATVTHNVDDLFVHMSDPPASPCRSEFDDAHVLNFSGLNYSLAYQRYVTYLDTMYSYGCRNFMIYVWGTWAWGEGTGWPKALPKSSKGGSEADFVAMLDTAKAHGNRIGMYTYYHYYEEENKFAEPNPLFDPDDATKNRDGSLKYHSPYTTEHWMAPDASLYYGQLVEQEIQDLYHINLAYEDSTSGQTPHANLLSQYSPDGHVDNLRDGIISYKYHFLQAKGIHKGPYLGEGTLVASNPSHITFDTLHAGYVDALERHLGLPEGENNNYYVIPDYELRVAKPHLVGLAFGFPQRFVSSYYPIPEDKYDELLATVITYGHANYMTCNGIVGDNGDYITEGDEVRSHYMLSASLQPLYLSSDVDEILYWNGTGYVSLSQAFTDSMDLVNPRIRISYDNGLVIFVNHSDTPWTVSAAGTSFLLEKDAWVAHHPGSGLVEFSAVPSGHSDRFDYVISPNRFEMIDGRGNSTTYGGISATDFKVVWKNGFTVSEDSRAWSITPPPVVPGAALVVKGSSGSTVAQLDGGGNLRLAGRCYRYADISPAAEAEFIVKSSLGDPVALINRAGDLFLKGVTHENLPSLSSAPGTDFSVKGSGGQILLRIDDSGHAYLLGQVLDSSL